MKDMKDIKEKCRINISSIEYIVYIVVFLIIIDLITTAVALELGLEEGNSVTLFFMDIFGTYEGLAVSIFGKMIVVILPMILYEFISNRTDTLIKNSYMVLYTIVIILAIISTLYTDINNTMLLIDTLL